MAEPRDSHRTRRVQIRVHGIVQGVGYRYGCRARAVSAGVAGWVRNLPDGGVEAELEGESGAVDAVVEWARTGPSLARVTDLAVVEQRPCGDVGFEIR